MYSRITVICLLLICGATGCDRHDVPPAVTTGSIEGAHYKLALPDDWNGKVLVLAHGWRPPDKSLVAVLDETGLLARDLTDEGWLIAATSYRRNGLIIADAMTDIDNLLTYVAMNFGQPRQVVVEGASMGAAIALLLAERGVDEAGRVTVHGVVAVGAALEYPGEDGPLSLTHQPHVPVLLMSNRSEIESAAGYAAQAAASAWPPALWRLERDGHVNLNNRERLAAIRAVDLWINRDVPPRGEAPDGRDATVDCEERRSRAREEADGLTGVVTAVDPVYGNLDTSFVATDLRRLDIDVGGAFLLRCGDRSYAIRLGQRYGDVEAGELVAFLTATGTLRVAVNLGDAAARLGCLAGAPLLIETIIEPISESTAEGGRP